MELRLRNGEKLSGRLGPVGPETIELQTSAERAATGRQIAFAEVASVRVRHVMTTKTKFALGLGIFADMAVLVTALVFSAIGRNG